MAKHHKKANIHSLPEYQARLQRCRSEGRYQLALELAKHLYSQDNSQANLDVLKDVYYHRAIQLRKMGQPRDAATVLEVASRYDPNDPQWLRLLAQEMAQCGDTSRLEQLLTRIKALPTTATTADTTASLLTSLQGPLVDAAILQEKEGRDRLPVALQGEYDRVLLAFQQVEKGQDEAARDTLHPIGLRSPFLEWKVYLRGLMAYYQNDDPRAVENWQRLDPARLPARLAAPYRAEIDPSYLKAQSEAAQTILRNQLAKLKGDSLQTQLTALRRAMSNPESLAPAFRVVERILLDLRAVSAALVSRLAHCFYWAIRRTSADDIRPFIRVFGTLPEDPHFERLRALVMEENGGLEEAHQSWGEYEQTVAKDKTFWSDEQRSLARALIWQRRGDNAASLPNEQQRRKLPRFLRESSDLPAPLQPDAIVCYQKAIELQPDLLEAHEGLFKYLISCDKIKEALQVGQQLLARFPDHVATMEKLAELYLQENQPLKALEFIQNAFNHNPLDNTLRDRLSMHHLVVARQYTEKGNYEEARKHYQSGLTYCPASQHWNVYCRWAASEVKAGDPARAEQLLQKALSSAAGDLLINYCMLVEVIRLQLSTAEKTRRTREFNSRIDTLACPAVALALVEYVTSLQQSNISYHGQKTHSKKIVKLALNLPLTSYNEQQLVALLRCFLFLELPAREFFRLCRFGQSHFPKNPFFFYLHACYHMGDNPDECGPIYDITRLLDSAEKLAKARLAEDPGMASLLEDIRNRQQLVQALNPFMGRLIHLFGHDGSDDEDL